MPGPYGNPARSSGTYGVWRSAVPTHYTQFRFPRPSDPVLDVIETDGDAYQNDPYYQNVGPSGEMLDSGPQQGSPGGTAGVPPHYQTPRWTAGVPPHYQSSRGTGGTPPHYQSSRGAGGSAPHPADNPYYQTSNQADNPYYQTSGGGSGGSAPHGGHAPQSQRSDFLPADHRKVHAMGGLRILLSKQPHYQGEEAREVARVKYVTDLAERRSKYQIEVGAKLRRRGRIFDTREVRSYFQQKYRARGVQKLGVATLGPGLLPPQEWIEESLIWVCAVDPDSNKPTFYSHVGKINRFHHTSLVGGEEVIGAGEWIVRDGRLKKISANSGHYQPTIEFLYRSVLHLAAAFQSDTTVFLYDSYTGQYVERPILDFIRAPSASGRYWAHMRSGK